MIVRHSGMLLLGVLLFSACTPTTTTDPRGPAPRDEQDRGPSRPVDLSHVPDAVPRHEVRTAAGNRSPYTVLGRTYYLMEDETNYRERGLASWYGKKFHGRLTSNGEIYDMYAMTAAHKTLPIPSYVRVTNLENQRSVVVRVNDRGPFHADRIIDLSYAAAHRLGFVDQGVARVDVEIILPEGDPPPLMLTPVSNTAGENNLPENAYLQVGAFGSRDAAERLRTEVANLTELPVIIHATRSSPALFRVRVGPIPGSNQLQALHRTLQQNNIDQAHLVYQ